MKQRIVIAALCLFLPLSAGLVLLAARQQQQKKSATMPATPVRVEPAKESDTTGQTVAAARAFLATLDDAGRAKVLAPFDDEHKVRPAAQPAIYKLNGETVRPLGRENDKGFALVNSLDETQRKQAILSYQVGDLVLGAREDGKTIQPEGIKAGSLNAAQQQMLLDLARE